MFLVWASLAKAFRITFKHFWGIFFGTIFAYIPSIIILIAQKRLGQDINFQIFIYYVIQVYLSFGYINFLIHTVKSEDIRLANFFISGGKFFKLLIAGIVYTVLILAGFIILVVPGLIFLAKFMFFPYFILEKDCGIMESLRFSSRITKGTRWKLLWFLILTLFISLVGITALLIGYFIAEAITSIAFVIIYLRLLGKFSGAAGKVQPNAALKSGRL